jgi:hypothetical protein
MRRAYLLAALAMVSLVPGEAQFNSALQGTITDTSGAVVPGGTVRVTNAATGITVAA